jgi:hypothetical protein
MRPSQETTYYSSHSTACVECVRSVFDSGLQRVNICRHVGRISISALVQAAKADHVSYNFIYLELRLYSVSHGISADSRRHSLEPALYRRQGIARTTSFWGVWAVEYMIRRLFYDAVYLVRLRTVERGEKISAAFSDLTCRLSVRRNEVNYSEK